MSLAGTLRLVRKPVWASVVSLAAVSLTSVAAGLAALALSAAGGLPACVALALLVIYGCVVLISRRYGRAWNPVTLFFIFAIAHAVLGFLSAAPTTVYLYRPTSGIYGVFEKSFFIVSASLAAMMSGYVAGLHFQPRKAFGWCLTRLRALDFEPIVRRSRTIALAGLPAIAIVFWQIGEVPMLMPDPGTARFLQFLRPEFKELVWVQNRCIDVFQVAVPCLIASMVIRRRRGAVDAVLVGLSVLAAVAVVQRGPLISMLVTSAVALFSGRRLRLLIAAAPAFLLIYLGTQYFILNWHVRLEPSLVFELYGQALPEVRDLAWFLSSLGDQRLWGVTFLYALLPLPGFLSFESIKLRNITLEAIGLPLDSPIGGIRILFAGECYANFGYPGVIAAALVYGLLLGWLSLAFQALRNDGPRSFGGLFILASVFVLLSFWLYLGGTNAAGAIRFQLLMLLILAWPLRRKTSAERGSSAGLC